MLNLRIIQPNQGLELTASSVRSCLAPASGSSSGLAFGFNCPGEVATRCSRSPGQEGVCSLFKGLVRVLSV